jgi:hypothetical protein
MKSGNFALLAAIGRASPFVSGFSEWPRTRGVGGRGGVRGVQTGLGWGPTTGVQLLSKLNITVSRAMRLAHIAWRY